MPQDKVSATLLTLIAIASLSGVAVFMGELPTDLRSFYFAGRVFAEGGNIYDYRALMAAASEAGIDRHVFPYLYPPGLAFYSMPFSQLDPALAKAVWGGLSMLLAVTVMLLSRALAGRLAGRVKQPDGWLPLLVLLWFILLPFDNNMSMGQVNMMVLACMVAALWLSLQQGRDVAAGLLLAPAVLIKVTPIGLLVFFLLERRPKVALGCAAGLALLLIPTLLDEHGLRSWGDFLQYSATLGYGSDIPGLAAASTLPNFSVAGCVSRLLANPLNIKLGTVLVLAVMSVCLLIQHVRYARRGAGAWLLLPYLVLMIVGSPLAYLHHVIYVFPGLLLSAWLVMGWGCRYRAPILLGLGVCAVIASTDFPSLYRPLGIHWPLLQSLNLYALLGLFGLGLLIPACCEAEPAVTKEPETHGHMAGD